MTWKREKVARLERTNATLQITGFMGERHCGCGYMQGRRIDDGEPTFGAWPCDQHGAQNERAMQTVQSMPPQDEEMHLLWQRLLDTEITPYLATNEGERR